MLAVCRSDLKSIWKSPPAIPLSLTYACELPLMISPGGAPMEYSAGKGWLLTCQMP